MQRRTSHNQPLITQPQVLSVLMQTVLATAIEPFPSSVDIEGITVTGFPNPKSLFERLVQETRRSGQTLVHYLNIHVANTAFSNTRLKGLLQQSDLVYCDGAGIVAGAKLMGQVLP